jgi:ferrous iron transport protein B
MAFILIYFPCIAVVAAMAKESGSWKIALFTAAYTTILAWVMAFIVYNSIQLIS